MPMKAERDEVQFREPVLEQKNVKARISFAESTEWRPKEAVRALDSTLQDSYKACKLSVILTDDSLRTEHADALPKLVIDDQFNVVKYPYLNKKTGGVSFLSREKLFALESAFGFDPVFVDADGNEVEPFITRNGNKVAPKLPGVARVLNPSFVSSYFNEDMTVNPTNWIDKVILVDVGVETNEQFGNKNTIQRYKKVESI